MYLDPIAIQFLNVAIGSLNKKDSSSPPQKQQQQQQAVK